MSGVFENCYQNREAKITKSFCSGIINLLFDGFTYNTRGHFAHCLSVFPRPFGARKNTTQLAKYPRVLYVKPSNKIYIFFARIAPLGPARPDKFINLASRGIRH